MKRSVIILAALVLSIVFFGSAWAERVIGFDSSQHQDPIFEAALKVFRAERKHIHAGFEYDIYYDPDAMFRVTQYAGRLAVENQALKKEVERLNKEKVALVDTVKAEKQAFVDRLATMNKERSSLHKIIASLAAGVGYYRTQSENSAVVTSWFFVAALVLIVALLGMIAWEVTLRSEIKSLRKDFDETVDNLNKIARENLEAQNRIMNLESRLLSAGEKPNGGRYNPPVDGIDPEERIV